MGSISLFWHLGTGKSILNLEKNWICHHMSKLWGSRTLRSERQYYNISSITFCITCRLNYEAGFRPLHRRLCKINGGLTPYAYKRHRNHNILSWLATRSNYSKKSKALVQSIVRELLWTDLYSRALTIYFGHLFKSAFQHTFLHHGVQVFQTTDILSKTFYKWVSEVVHRLFLEYKFQLL